MWQVFQEKHGLLTRHQELGEQHQGLNTLLEVLTKQNSEAYARIAAKYGSEDLDSTVAELEEWLADMGARQTEWQADLAKIVHEIRVSHDHTEESCMLHQGLRSCISSGCVIMGPLCLHDALLRRQKVQRQNSRVMHEGRDICGTRIPVTSSGTQGVLWQAA